GLAVPDWPLSFGMLLPPMRGGILFEHGHRLAAALVGCLTMVLALWTVVGEPRPGVRALGLTALLAVILQGVLGGVTVLYKLPLAVSVTHACLAQAFFCLTVTLALVTGAGWTAARPRDVTPGLARLAAVAAGLVLVQLALGALVIWSRRAVLPTTTHLVVGAALLATCLVLALRAGRVAAPRAAEASALRVRRQALA